MSVSLCVLRIEIDEDLPEMGDNPVEMEAAKEQKKKDRGARESKTITVETYASVLTGPNMDTGILPTSSRRSPPEHSMSEDEDTISFFCGNPLVEVTKGVLHLYKENEMKEAEEAKTLCLLSVPGALGAPDLLAFAAACQQDIAHVRVLRDGSPDHYMALFTFRTSDAAREFHETFDGVPYSSLEPNALCHMAWVSRVEWARDGTPPPSHTELPTCPVCLERMDESVAGVLSVQCAHAFHAECLVRWRDARCPVCRCAQTPEPRGQAVCFQCERAALAAKHFLASNHTYALQLGSNRVWDYAVQNKADGKLVAAEGGFTSEDSACGGEKLDSAQLEFTYILTQQLDSQRMFYEEKMNKLEAEHISECEKLRFRATEAEASSSKLSEQVATLTKENKNLERKLQQVTNKLSVLQNELSEERGLAAALANSQAEWQARAKLKEETFVKEVSELKEQLRDMMFFVEARGQLQQANVSQDELAAAQVSVAPPPKPRRRRR
ncbi:hypothetical protein HF086_002010 [Spodoptera exigua]|uniref:RING-type domain-containing protein n=1 Tax=Spodoptera exigua TaxID=7107 RepID=A0A922MK50_SPOEX|nr:hypothetical protein HF086_002010 [Spodoptera exigua]